MRAGGQRLREEETAVRVRVAGVRLRSPLGVGAIVPRIGTTLPRALAGGSLPSVAGVTIGTPNAATKTSEISSTGVKVIVSRTSLGTSSRSCLLYTSIAAANAISDVYAMGGTPLTALNIAAFPVERLGTEILARILEGGAATAREAGVAILGGHTIERCV